jgi:hypothetical protein
VAELFVFAVRDGVSGDCYCVGGDDAVRRPLAPQNQRSAGTSVGLPSGTYSTVRVSE